VTPAAAKNDDDGARLSTGKKPGFSSWSVYSINMFNDQAAPPNSKEDRKRRRE